jgi:hypothetical protein
LRKNKEQKMITPKRLIKNAEEYTNEPAFSFKDEN